MSVLNILDEYINNNPNNYISKEKGLDVDKPRNLAKSVTVE